MVCARPKTLPRVMKSTQNTLVPSTEHQWSEMSAQSLMILKDDTHSCRLTTHTGVSAAVLPDYRTASFHRLWDSWSLSQLSTLIVFSSCGIKIIHLVFHCTTQCQNDIKRANRAEASDINDGSEYQWVNIHFIVIVRGLSRNTYAG